MIKAKRKCVYAHNYKEVEKHWKKLGFPGFSQYINTLIRIDMRQVNLMKK